MFCIELKAVLCKADLMRHQEVLISASRATFPCFSSGSSPAYRSIKMFGLLNTPLTGLFAMFTPTVTSDYTKFWLVCHTTHSPVYKMYLSIRIPGNIPYLSFIKNKRFLSIYCFYLSEVNHSTTRFRNLYKTMNVLIWAGPTGDKHQVRDKCFGSPSPRGAQTTPRKLPDDIQDTREESERSYILGRCPQE